MSTPSLPVQLSDVQAAAVRIQGAATMTPVLRSIAVDKLSGVSAHFKCEHLQVTGSFKFRGALNSVLSLDGPARQRGVVTHSSGNHGAALAAAAARETIPCTVVVPNSTPEHKLQNMQKYGANVVLCEPTQKGRHDTMMAEAEKMGGATVVHPYDTLTVIAGQGTIGLELLQQVPSLDAILVPTSGGGMVTGIAVAATAIKPGIRVIAVEPRGKRLAESLAAGQRILDEEAANTLLPTIADAIRTQPLGPNAWTLAEQVLDRTVLPVDDDQIKAAMRMSMDELKQVVEPAGGVALAGLLSPEFKALKEQCAKEGKPLNNVGLVVCGGNVSVEALLKLLAD